VKHTMIRKVVGILWILLSVASFVYAQPGKISKVVMMKVFEKELAKTGPMVGVVDFDKNSGISPEVSGLIDVQSIPEGAVVKKGTVLIRLKTDFIRKQIEIMKKELEHMDIRIGNTRKNLRRYEVLYKKEAVSEKLYDDLADTLKESLKNKEILQKNLEKLELEKNKSTIRAPFDGLILETYKNEGEWVSPGTPVCLLASTSEVFVKVALSEDLVRYVQPETRVSVRINALDRTFSGTVKKYVPIADIQSKTFHAKVAIPYFSEAIQNMSATVNIPVSAKTKLRMIKRDALVRFQGKEFVYTVKEGKAKILPVNIVAFAGEYFGVDSPHVQVGMSVVVDGNDRLRPDEAVEIIRQ